jgi:hypothetical protein
VPASHHSITIMFQVFAHPFCVELIKCFFFHSRCSSSPILFSTALNTFILPLFVVIIFSYLLRKTSGTRSELIIKIIANGMDLIMLWVDFRLVKMFAKADSKTIYGSVRDVGKLGRRCGSSERWPR